MSIMESHGDRQQRKVDQWRRQGLYPEGCKNWESFIDFCNRNTGKPFVIILESIGGRPESVIKEYVFGIMNTEGARFGLNSFSLVFLSFSSGFQGQHHRGYHFFQHGHSEKGLGLRSSLFGRKISEVSFEAKKINTSLCVYGMMMSLVGNLERQGDSFSPEEIQHYAQMYQDMGQHFFSQLPQEGFHDSHRTFEQLKSGIEKLLSRRLSETKKALQLAEERYKIYVATTKLLE